jgi:hypothetical protein
VGIHDNFFELGGHSLLATVLASRLQERFGKDVPIHTIFTMPTIVQLAQDVDSGRRDTYAVPAPPVTRIERKKGRRPSNMNAPS